MLAGPLQTVAAKPQTVTGKLFFILILQRVQGTKGSRQWGRGRSRICPRAWVWALHPPAVASTFFTRPHGPASLLDMFMLLVN